MEHLVLARGFFDLQLRFARHAAALQGLPLEQALLEYTNLTVRFGRGRGCPPEDPVWQRFLKGIPDDAGLLDWTERFYRERRRAARPARGLSGFGCFTYADHGQGAIKLHFRDAEVDGGSPLARGRQGARRADLAALCAHASSHLGPELQVHGASWLYNLEAYRRIFPKAYVETARPLSRQFRRMPLWGQFLDRRGGVRTEPAQTFLAALSVCEDPSGLDRCFPLPVQELAAPLRVFMEEYAVGATP